MNSAQRKRVDVIIESAKSSIERMKERGAAIANDAATELESIAEEERDKFDNLTEGLQATERGQAISEAADTLESAVSDLQTIEAEFNSLYDALIEVLETLEVSLDLH